MRPLYRKKTQIGSPLFENLPSASVPSNSQQSYLPCGIYCIAYSLGCPLYPLPPLQLRQLALNAVCSSSWGGLTYNIWVECLRYWAPFHTLVEKRSSSFGEKVKSPSPLEGGRRKILSQLSVKDASFGTPATKSISHMIAGAVLVGLDWPRVTWASGMVTSSHC